MEDDGLGLGVVEQIAQLGADIAIVDVERGTTSQVRADHALEVLAAVVEREGDEVLSGLVTSELGALRVSAESS